jgi:hypothetical protein
VLITPAACFDKDKTVRALRLRFIERACLTMLADEVIGPSIEEFECREYLRRAVSDFAEEGNNLGKVRDG